MLTKYWRLLGSSWSTSLSDRIELFGLRRAVRPGPGWTRFLSRLLGLSLVFRYRFYPAIDSILLGVTERSWSCRAVNVTNKKHFHHYYWYSAGDVNDSQRHTQNNSIPNAKYYQRDQCGLTVTRDAARDGILKSWNTVISFWRSRNFSFEQFV